MYAWAFHSLVRNMVNGKKLKNSPQPGFLFLGTRELFPRLGVQRVTSNQHGCSRHDRHFICSANVVHRPYRADVCLYSQTDQRVKKSKVAQTRAISTLTPLSSDFPETDPSYRAALNPRPCLRGSEPALSRYRRHAQTDTSPGAACIKPFKARN